MDEEEKRDKCTCKWVEHFEGELLGTTHKLIEVDKRCAEHGSKPRRT